MRTRRPDRADAGSSVRRATANAPRLLGSGSAAVLGVRAGFGFAGRTDLLVLGSNSARCADSTAEPSPPCASPSAVARHGPHSDAGADTRASTLVRSATPAPDAAPVRSRAVIDQHIEIQTRDGAMNTFVTHPEEGGPFPVVFFYMDAPGKREELHDMARRIGSGGYYVVLPNLYYRTVREFDFTAGEQEETYKRMFELHGHAGRRPRRVRHRGDVRLRRRRSERRRQPRRAASATA